MLNRSAVRIQSNNHGTNYISLFRVNRIRVSLIRHIPAARLELYCLTDERICTRQQADESVLHTRSISERAGNLLTVINTVSLAVFHWHCYLRDLGDFAS